VSHRAHRITAVLGTLVAALALAAGSTQAAVSSTIRAYFDADGHLMFTFADGSQVVGTIPPGTYQVIYDNFGADDLAVDHALHLFGPGIDFAPGPAVVQSIFSVTFLANATYTLRDDLHPAIGGRSFVATTNAGGAEPSGGSSSGGSVGATPSTSAKSSTKAVSNDIVGADVLPLRGTLAGTVDAAGKLTLSFRGTGVSQLKAGRYKIAVDDRASKTAFKVQRIKKQPITLTGEKFVGKKTVTVALDAGQWWFFSGGPRKTFFVVIR
jgi:hypothetical protein